MSVTGVPPEAIRREFAKNLQDRLSDKGWTQSEFARRVKQLLPDRRFGRDSISKYLRGKNLPLPPILTAMCTVLGVESKDLLPSRATRAVAEGQSAIVMREIDGDRAWLEINHFSRALPYHTALKILALLKSDEVAT